MTLTFLRRFRSPVIALVAIVFSATIALAGQPAGKTSGQANASNHTGKTAHTQASHPTSDESAEPDESDDTDTDAGDADGEGDQANHCNVDLTGDLGAFTHGQIVCTAAHMETPEGYANHGAWVSHWAKQNHGSDAAANGKAHKPSH
jgi:hypothetical protein